MTFLRKTVPAASKDISLTIKAPENKLSQVEADIKKIVAKATPEDIAAIAALLDNPAKLAMARKFM